MFVGIEAKEYAVQEGVWRVVGVFKVSVEFEELRKEWEYEGEGYLAMDGQ